MQVTVPEKLQTQLKAEMEAAGIPLPSSDQRWDQALTALKVAPAPPPNRIPSHRHHHRQLHRGRRSGTNFSGGMRPCWISGQAHVHVTFPHKRAYMQRSPEHECVLGSSLCCKQCDVDLAWLQGVWASMYNERAMLSMRKVGIDFRDIRMAVLVQRIVPAAYAFVIHTVNPTNGALSGAAPFDSAYLMWNAHASVPQHHAGRPLPPM